MGERAGRGSHGGSSCVAALVDEGDGAVAAVAVPVPLEGAGGSEEVTGVEEARGATGLVAAVGGSWALA